MIALTWGSRTLWWALISSFAVLIVLVACPAPEPPGTPRDTSIHLELINTWTTNLTFRISVGDTTQSWRFALSRDDSIILDAKVFGTDTTIIDPGLEPGRDYSYTAYFVEGDEIMDSTHTLTVTTLDTTSHDFTWTINTLGNYGSYLNDVAIISEDDIWVVGMLETDSGSYNAAHWDGSEWEIHRILRPVDFEGVYAFASNDIWFVDGCKVFHYDGNDFTELWMCDWAEYGINQVTCIWGTSSSNMYFVGDGGSIVHYDGSTFSKMESGTDIKLRSIHGSSDGNHVFVSGHSDVEPQGSIVLDLKAGTWQRLYESDSVLPHGPDEYGYIYTVHIEGETLYATASEGLWKYNYLTETSSYEQIPLHSYAASHSTGSTDVFLVTRGFVVSHFNGITWHHDDHVVEQYGAGNIYARGADLLNDFLGVVGYINGGEHAVIARGTRQ